MSQSQNSTTPDDPDGLGPLAAPAPGEGGEGPAADFGMGRPRSDPEPQRRKTNLPLIGGLAVAALLGVGVGLTAPQLMRSQSRPPAPDTRTPEGAGVQVQVDTVKTAPVPDGPTSIMPTVPPGAPDAPPEAVRPAPPPPAPRAEAPEPPAPQRDFIADLADERAGDLEPADVACAYSAANPDSGCADPDLIRADEALTAAYRAAGRAGVPPRVLREDARNWRSVSEDAAHRSRAALLDAYRARADEVWALADEADQGRRLGRR